MLDLFNPSLETNMHKLLALIIVWQPLYDSIAPLLQANSWKPPHFSHAVFRQLQLVHQAPHMTPSSLVCDQSEHKFYDSRTKELVADCTVNIRAQANGCSVFVDETMIPRSAHARYDDYRLGSSRDLNFYLALLEAGADPRDIDRDGNNLLHLIAKMQETPEASERSSENQLLKKLVAICQNDFNVGFLTPNKDQITPIDVVQDPKWASHIMGLNLFTKEERLAWKTRSATLLARKK
jgi:hypothetical protein